MNEGGLHYFGLPHNVIKKILLLFSDFFFLEQVKGVEPSARGTTIRCSNHLSYTHHIHPNGKRCRPTEEVRRQKVLHNQDHYLEGSFSMQLNDMRV